MDGDTDLLSLSRFKSALQVRLPAIKPALFSKTWKNRQNTRNLHFSPFLFYPLVRGTYYRGSVCNVNFTSEILRSSALESRLSQE